MKRVGTIEELISILKDERDIYLIGAGKDGKEVISRLEAVHIHVNGILDEDERKYGTLINDVQVYDASGVVASSETKFVLCIGELSSLADTEIMNTAIVRQLINGELIILDKGIGVLHQFIKDCKESNIGIDDSVIDILGVRIPNFLRMSDMIRKVFLSECNDLIMPALFNDWSMIDEGPYEACGVHLSQGDVVIDCGANIGLFAAYAASKGCRVYAFEPIPQTVEILKMTQDLYGDSIQIVKKALSNETGLSKMTNIEYLGQNRMRRYEFDDGRELIDVETITIDEFVRQNNIRKIDFIKSDIEGAERDMLKGATEALKNMAPQLSICTYHMVDDREVIESIVKKSNPNYMVKNKYKKLYARV